MQCVMLSQSEAALALSNKLNLDGTFKALWSSWLVSRQKVRNDSNFIFQTTYMSHHF